MLYLLGYNNERSEQKIKHFRQDGYSKYLE